MASEHGTRAEGFDKESNMKLATRILMSILICLSFAVFGATEVVRGPTLLDLVAIYKADLSLISFIAVISSIGYIVGTLLGGMMHSRWPSQGFLLMFIHLVFIAIFTFLIPRSGHTYFFLLAVYGHGHACGAIDVGGNILILEMWRGLSGGGPFLHSIHFAFSFGALMAPIMSLPFLSNKSEHRDTIKSTLPTSPIAVNATSTEEFKSDNDMATVASNLNNLYAIMAIGPLLVSLGFLIKIVIDATGGSNGLGKSISDGKKEAKSEEHKDVGADSKDLLILRRVIVVLSGVMLAIYAGTEYCAGNFLPAFGTLSKLALSKKSSANLASIFWAAFSFMRFVGIFMAMKLSPLATLAISFTLASVGSMLSVMLGETSLTLMQIASALMGLGLSPIYASCFLWIEGHMEVSPAIGTYFVLVTGIGNNICGIIMGYALGRSPEILLFFILASISGSASILFILLLLARQLPFSKNEHQDAPNVIAEGLERSVAR